MIGGPVDLEGGFNRMRPCRHGLMVYNRNDRYVGRSLDLYGEYAEYEVALFRSVVRPGDVVVEVGANIGAQTLPLARIVGPSGTVIAFEPQEMLFNLLSANLALNGVTSVRARRMAVGSEAGTIRVPTLDPNCSNNFGALGLGGWDHGELVPLVTLDSLNLPSCRLLKADVEGMEEAVLRGASGLIARHRPVLYVENDRRDCSPALIGLIRSMGYRVWWHTARLFHPDNFAGNSTDLFGGVGAVNLVALPPGSDIHIPEPEITDDHAWWQ
ncbi:FkbM family methyltransferase [Azospirillum sp. TSH64]|uniref:FkbM family methyltransferase n=1 Tax=Azospirillum sp. TSH64 TaxID=652740 RepID=UPI001304E581|nr:FkbM family methyltransferase [Azospirillum sp. TSH64]